MNDDKLSNRVKVGQAQPIVKGLSDPTFPRRPNAIPINRHSWVATGNRAYGHPSTHPVYMVPSKSKGQVEYRLADKKGRITPHGATAMRADFTIPGIPRPPVVTRTTPLPKKVWPPLGKAPAQVPTLDRPTPRIKVKPTHLPYRPPGVPSISPMGGGPIGGSKGPFRKVGMY